jgi:hypothetical protein
VVQFQEVRRLRGSAKPRDSSFVAVPLPPFTCQYSASGVCAYCGLRGFVDPAGALYVLYRQASAMTNRGEVLIASRDQGRHFTVFNSDPWQTGTCPMSSAFLSASGGDVLGAWETAAQVYWVENSLFHSDQH